MITVILLNSHILDFYYYHGSNTSNFIWNKSYWVYNVPTKNDHVLNLEDFCKKSFGNVIGLEIIFVLLSSFNMISAIRTSHIPWPFSIIATIFAIIRSLICIILINTYLNVHTLLQVYIIVIFTIYAIASLIEQFHYELSLRNEYQSFRKTTFSHLFLELSLDTVQKNLKKPLSNILEYKEMFLNIVLDIALKQKIEFTSTILSDFNTLNMGQLLLRELEWEFDFKENLTQTNAYNNNLNNDDINQNSCRINSSNSYRKIAHNNEKYSNDMISLYQNSNEAFLLIEESLKIAASFSCFHSDFQVKVYVDVCPTLTLLRTNGKMFESVIINAISKALKSIWVRLRGNDHLRSYVQEISVIVTPLKTSKGEHFF